MTNQWFIIQKKYLIGCANDTKKRMLNQGLLWAETRKRLFKHCSCNILI